MKERKKLVITIGYIILIVACLLFILIPVVPFLNLTVRQKAGISTGLFIAGEVLFYLSLVILGKSFYEKIKKKLKFWRTKKDEVEVSEGEV